MRFLKKALLEGSFLLDIDARDMRSILRQTLSYVVATGLLSEDKRDEVEDALMEREAWASTAIGNATAVPHAYLDAFKEPIIVFVRLAHPLNLGAPDQVPTQFVFVLLGPTGAATRHLDALANIARLMVDDEFRYEAGVARTQLDLLGAVDQFVKRTAPSAVGVEKTVPQSLEYTGRLFGGLIQDIHRRWPWYASDFRDGLHVKSVASTLFLYFACLAPAVTFGGILAELTNNEIGAIEMIIASAFCGVAYALFSGQPMVILGGTGPLLIFTWMLYVLCVTLGIEDQFLEARAWVGLWTALLMLILAATDASSLVRFFTRFTDEIFAALIAIIFVYASIEAMFRVVHGVYAQDEVSHDGALVPLLLAAGTFYIAMSLSRFRRSRYLLPRMREFLADFGPAIALGAMTAVAVMWFEDVEIITLPVPDSIRPTTDRGWYVDPFQAPRWVWFASLGPAVLVAVLAYVDQNITARLVNSRDHKLKKGEAYHYDLAIVGVLIGICSLFGLPWLVAATVRSLNHVHSLATMEEVVSKGGDVHERIIHVRETRVTGTAIHLLIGLSVLALPLLMSIPMAVLYGLFLFMGIVSLSGNQFIGRLGLWLTDPSLYPVTHYIRRVPMPTIHKFTLLQFGCLVVLGIVEITPAGMLFPLILLLLIPVRHIAARYFAPEHLAALDAEEDPDEEETHWV